MNEQRSQQIMYSSSASPQTIDTEDFRQLHEEIDERDYFYNNEEYAPPLSQSLTDALDPSRTTRIAIIVSILLVAVVHWKSSIEQWYRNLKFRLEHLTVRECLVDWGWMCIDYGRGAWFIGLEMLRNSFFILNGGSNDPKRNGMRAGSLAHRESSNLASMPDLLPDDQFSENVDETTSGARSPLEARNPREDKRASNRIPQTHKELQNEREEVEPAFRQERNYPPGWLVFHSVLGVVHKGVADEYERRRHRLAAEASGAKSRKPQLMNTISHPCVGNEVSCKKSSYDDCNSVRTETQNGSAPIT